MAKADSYRQTLPALDDWDSYGCDSDDTPKQENLDGDL